MVQRRGRAGLLLESMEAIGVGRERDRQDLDRHVTTQPRIARAVDVAHAARANERDDFIGAEPCAGGKTHRPTLILPKQWNAKPAKAAWFDKLTMSAHPEPVEGCALCVQPRRSSSAAKPGRYASVQ